MNKLFAKYPLLSNLRVIGWTLFVLIIIASLHRYYFSTYNNFFTFKFSFVNLLAGTDMYILHPEQHEDLYKYSPTFALFMAPFSVLPVWLGYTLWNLLNAMLLFLGVKGLKLDNKQKAVILFFVFIELLTSVQNSQSNGLMTGLILLAFNSFENKKPVLAALFICLGFYVKLFALAAALLFFFYDKKFRFIIAMCCWGALLAVLPILVSGYDGLLMQYKSWFALLAIDPSHELNFSVMTFMQRVFHVELSDLYYLAPGALLLMLPLIHRKEYHVFGFRLLLLASILIWVVIFNHKAESPTFIIAMTGVALWWSIVRNTPWSVFLAVFVFVITGLIATDLFPEAWRSAFFRPYAIKVVPCIVAWIYLTVLLVSRRYREQLLPDGQITAVPQKS